MKTLRVVDYDPTWPDVYRRIRDPIVDVLDGVMLSIEHVGSTSVPGLAAKPIVDMTVVVRDAAGVEGAIAGLARLGYRHRGDLGIQGREAFESPSDLPPHHLYVCVEGCSALRNHLLVRNYLRENPGEAKRYGELKKKLAAEFSSEIERYIDGKTDFLTNILSLSGMAESEVSSISDANRL